MGAVDELLAREGAALPHRFKPGEDREQATGKVAQRIRDGDPRDLWSALPGLRPRNSKLETRTPGNQSPPPTTPARRLFSSAGGLGCALSRVSTRTSDQADSRGEEVPRLEDLGV